MSKTTLTIRGMSCGHCVAGVKKALTDLPGIKVLDVAVGKAVVESEGELDTRAVRRAIEEEGYEVLTIA